MLPSSSQKTTTSFYDIQDTSFFLNLRFIGVGFRGYIVKKKVQACSITQEQKKFGKQLNAERIKNKAAEKRMAIDAISQIRKRRKSNNGSAFDVDVAVDKIASQSRHYNGGSNSSSGHSSKFNKYQRGRDAE